MENTQLKNNQKKFVSRKILGELVTPKMTRVFRKLGLAKNDYQAKYWMIAIIIICLLLIIYINTSVFDPNILWSIFR